VTDDADDTGLVLDHLRHCGGVTLATRIVITKQPDARRKRLKFRRLR
jgi:hypothetical protein